MIFSQQIGEPTSRVSERRSIPSLNRLTIVYKYVFVQLHYILVAAEVKESERNVYVNHT